MRIRIAFLGALLVLLGGRAGFAAPDGQNAQERYVRRAESQINTLAAGLRRAEKKQERLGKADRAECGETLGHLWKKEKIVRLRIEEIRKAPADQWKALRVQEDALLIHLQKNYQHLVNRYFR